MGVDKIVQVPEFLESRMDSDSVRKSLRVDTFEKDVDKKAVSLAIKQMCEGARRRVIFNFSGALPGPPAVTPTLSRKLLRLFDRVS